MHIKAILTATALVLVAGLGSASAEDQFNTIADLSPQALTVGEMREVHGAGATGAANFGAHLDLASGVSGGQARHFRVSTGSATGGVNFALDQILANQSP